LIPPAAQQVPDCRLPLPDCRLPLPGWRQPSSWHDHDDAGRLDEDGASPLTSLPVQCTGTHARGDGPRPFGAADPAVGGPGEWRHRVPRQRQRELGANADGGWPCSAVLLLLLLLLLLSAPHHQRRLSRGGLAGVGALPRGHREAAERVLRALQRQHSDVLLGAGRTALHAARAQRAGCGARG
jgi:hypothetical protein